MGAGVVVLVKLFLALNFSLCCACSLAYWEPGGASSSGSLVQVLSARGIDASGKKDQLVAKLEAAIAAALPYQHGDRVPLLEVKQEIKPSLPCDLMLEGCEQLSEVDCTRDVSELVSQPYSQLDGSGRAKTLKAGRKVDGRAGGRRRAQCECFDEKENVLQLSQGHVEPALDAPRRVQAIE